jgi:hypothetical protein
MACQRARIAQLGRSRSRRDASAGASSDGSTLTRIGSPTRLATWPASRRGRARAARPVRAAERSASGRSGQRGEHRGLPLERLLVVEGIAVGQLLGVEVADMQLAQLIGDVYEPIRRVHSQATPEEVHLGVEAARQKPDELGETVGASLQRLIAP